MNAEQKEELRHLAAEAVAVRYPAALTLRQIARAVRKESDLAFADEDLAAGLELLKGLSLVDNTADELGSTIYWRATPGMVLKLERGEI